MIATLEEIKLIRKGELDELRLDVEKAPAIDSTQAVQTRPGKRASCYVRVLDVWPHCEGGYVVRVALGIQQIPTRYLGRNGGYTTEIAYALRDSEEGANWAPPDGWDDLGTVSRERSRQRMIADQRERLSLGGQLDTLLGDARSSRMDVRNRLQKIEREIELLERDLSIAKGEAA